jgi:catechol 2,3-dioxygenase-like lactoylglutathione lyase family enzyme
VTERWTITVDCVQPTVVAAFWCTALGYVDAPPPQGSDSWEEWLHSFGVPPEEWDDGAALVDPDGVLPRLSFLKVPEPKVAKNLLHLDIRAGGGRHVPFDVRWPRVTAAVERLVAAGGTVVAEHGQVGVPDHVVMTDPEGNEFCVV